MKPTIGRIVHYHLSSEDVDKIRHQRTQGPFTGNDVNAGDCCAMLVTAVHDDNHVNGKVFLDGNDVLWALTVIQDNDGLAGSWRWPPRV